MFKKLFLFLIIVFLLVGCQYEEGIQNVPTESVVEPVISPTEMAIQYTEPLETIAPTVSQTEPEWITIDESWFDDALFIGDSRTVALKYVHRLGRADYFCESGMSVFTALCWRNSDERFYSAILEQVLSCFEYKKVFIELGINECGYEPSLIIESYQTIINMIRKYQPDAIIITQSVITVSEQKTKEAGLLFTLERINNLNELIYEMSQKNELFYWDTNEFAADENGYLRADLSSDGCHFHELGSMEWNDFIIKKSEELINMSAPEV